MRISDWSSDVCSSDLHTKGADQFAILGIAGRLDRAAALAAVESTFRPDEVAAAGDESLRARRGVCQSDTLMAAGTPGETGALCLDVVFNNGVVSQVALRQVVPGDAEDRKSTRLNSSH